MNQCRANRVTIPTRRQSFAHARELEPLPQLNIYPVPQFEDAWCYAACGEMVINFCHSYGTVNQCEIASFIKGPDCCNDFGNSLCIGSGCDKNEIQDIFVNWGVNFIGDNANPIPTISLAELTDEIDVVGNPVEIAIDWTDSLGSHALVLSGVSGDMVYIQDPLFTDTGWKTYDYLLTRDGGWFWNRTWMGLS